MLKVFLAAAAAGEVIFSPDKFRVHVTSADGGNKQITPPQQDRSLYLGRRVSNAAPEESQSKKKKDKVFCVCVFLMCGDVESDHSLARGSVLFQLMETYWLRGWFEICQGQTSFISRNTERYSCTTFSKIYFKHMTQWGECERVSSSPPVQQRGL